MMIERNEQVYDLIEGLSVDVFYDMLKEVDQMSAFGRIVAFGIPWEELDKNEKKEIKDYFLKFFPQVDSVTDDCLECFPREIMARGARYAKKYS